jgi:hypothetical protein
LAIQIIDVPNGRMLDLIKYISRILRFNINLFIIGEFILKSEE